MDILGVRVDNLAKNDALSKAREFLQSTKQHMVFTPNPEMIVVAQTDTYFQEVLQKGDLNLCDGKGIQFVAEQKIERIPGVDFMISLCSLAEKENTSVYLLGSGLPEVLEKCKQNLQQQFPNLHIAGVHPGISLTNLPNGQLAYDSDQNDEMLSDIILSSPDILFVAFGHTKQEKWIYENLPQLPSVKIAMGVGGAFDYISGNISRAPQWMQKLGLEWLYRLLVQPQRIKRIWNATVVFMMIFLKSKFKSKSGLEKSS